MRLRCQLFSVSVGSLYVGINHHHLRGLSLLIALHRFTRASTDTNDWNNEHGMGMAEDLVEPSELKRPNAFYTKPSLGGAHRRIERVTLRRRKERQGKWKKWRTGGSEWRKGRMDGCETPWIPPRLAMVASIESGDLIKKRESCGRLWLTMKPDRDTKYTHR